VINKPGKKDRFARRKQKKKMLPGTWRQRNGGQALSVKKSLRRSAPRERGGGGKSLIGLDVLKG